MRSHHGSRDGVIWLLAGCFVFGAAALVATATAEWRWVLYATPLFMLSFSMRLLLLVQPFWHPWQIPERL
jgi:hypothetical protein